MLKKGGNKMNRLMRHMGQEVVIHGRDGRSFRGIMDGFDPPKRGTETIRGMEGPHRKY